MIITHIQYTVRAEYVAEKNGNASLRPERRRAKIRPCRGFLHIPPKRVHRFGGICKNPQNEEAEQTFFQFQSLQAWRAALVESSPEVPLTAPTRLSVVGSTAKLL